VIFILKPKLVFLYTVSLLLFLIICVLAICSKNTIEKTVEEEEKINFESGNYINLLRSENKQIETLDLNYYLLCVVASEMPFKYEFEALKAQAVVARTYLFNKIQNNKEEQGDVCDNYTHCQAFNDIEKLEKIWKNKGYDDEEIRIGEEKIKKAILETDGKVITYNNEIINALFHASSPQKTEDASAIWSGEDVPYLKSVESVEEEDYEKRKSENIISYATFKNTLLDNGYIDDLTIDEFRNIQINEYTKSGRVKSISVGKYNIKAEDLRTLFGLNSTNFTFQINENNIEFYVLGYGHGVGLSQVGADTYAKQGLSYEDIIHHYYTNVEIVNISN
jgi:stage II sporulation protein D